MRSFFRYFVLVLLFYGVFFGCARRGNPTGGPIDSIPPVLLEANPILESVNFDAKKIKLTFDEYIKLKNVKQQLVVSPPQKYDPVIFPAGSASKFISIKILDTLDSNTTYSFNFGNSIVDNNEENELGNFKYVFSTGTYIDSLEVSGKVLDQTSKEIVKGIDVMLYILDSTYTDSIIFKEKPRYITNTLDTTLFDLTNLKAGKYRMIALKDNNFNKIYDPQSDKIGFVNEPVSIPTDTVYNFNIFKEIPELKVIKPKEINRGHLIFGFLGNAKDLNIELLTDTPDDFNAVYFKESGQDTLSYWYTPFEADSLNFRVSKGAYSEELVLTLRSEEMDSLVLNKNVASTLHILDTFSLSSNVPIADVDESLIQLMDKDSAFVAFKTYLSETKKRLYVAFEKEEENEYKLDIMPFSITDMFGDINDSISASFRTLASDDYGILNFDLRLSENTPLVAELLDSKNEIVRKKVLDSPQTVSFTFLPPGNYVLKVIIDDNGNGKWDTGNFLERRQPETIKFFENEIELRANYELNEIFNLN